MDAGIARRSPAFIAGGQQGAGTPASAGLRRGTLLGNARGEQPATSADVTQKEEDAVVLALKRAGPRLAT